jgi:aromatase
MHPDPNGNKWSWVSERVMDPAARTVRARRIELGWFHEMNIYWDYREVDGGVQMNWVQDFRMRADSPVSLEQMTTRISTNSPIQMAAIKAKIESAFSGAVSR